MGWRGAKPKGSSLFCSSSNSSAVAPPFDWGRGGYVSFSIPPRGEIPLSPPRGRKEDLPEANNTKVQQGNLGGQQLFPIHLLESRPRERQGNPPFVDSASLGPWTGQFKERRKAPLGSISMAAKATTLATICLNFPLFPIPPNPFSLSTTQFTISPICIKKNGQSKNYSVDADGRGKLDMKKGEQNEEKKREQNYIQNS
jgi:hypothetical protein